MGEYSTNSSEAVPGLAGWAGGILAACLVVVVAGIAVGVVAAYLAKKQSSSGAMVATLLTRTAMGALGAVVIASAGALVVAGADTFALAKVPAEEVTRPPNPVQECTESKKFELGAGTREEDLIADGEIDVQIYQADAQYWPNPTEDCGDGTVDACRMIHVTGTSGMEGGLGENALNKFDKWVKPKGECSDGEPKQVAF